MLKPLIVGNWKMHGLNACLDEVEALLISLGGTAPDHADILICPPATLLAPLAEQLNDSGLLCGGQDCHGASRGAHTGDISAEMLSDGGASHVIVGHSERREAYGESDETVRDKAGAAIAAGLSPIICIGESHAQRKAGDALKVVESQLLGSMPETETDTMVIAYEPVWAIGTGLTPTAEDIFEVHRHLRGHLGRATRILYGGSVKPENAAEILAIDDVNGALVGGASLKAKDFHAIIAAA